MSKKLVQLTRALMAALLLCLAACSSSPDELMMEGKTATEAGKFDEALALYDQALEAGAEDPTVVYGATWGKSQVFMVQQKYVEQIALLEGILGNESLQGQHTPTKDSLIVAYRALGASLAESDQAGSDAAYRKAIEHGDMEARNTLASSLTARAKAKHQEQAYSEATELFQAAKDLSPSAEVLREVNAGLLVSRRQLFQVPFLRRFLERKAQLAEAGSYNEEEKQLIFNVTVQVTTDRAVNRRSKSAAEAEGERLARAELLTQAVALARELGAGEGEAALAEDRVNVQSSTLARRSRRQRTPPRKYQTEFTMRAAISQTDFLNLAWGLSQ